MRAGAWRLREDTCRPWRSTPTSGLRRRVLVTGHTGFKGAWLSLWLQALGARASPAWPRARRRSPSLYELAGVGARMARARGRRARRRGGARGAARGAPRGRAAPRRPADGPALAARSGDDLRGERDGHGQRARGGAPGAAATCARSSWSPRTSATRTSRARARRATVRRGATRSAGAIPTRARRRARSWSTAAYRRSFFSAEDAPRVATARAGNVIGGGDWGEDRLVADVVRAVRGGRAAAGAQPRRGASLAARAEPAERLSAAAQELWRRAQAARAWNFGPREGDARTVRWIVERLARAVGRRAALGARRGREPARGGPSGARLERGRARPGLAPRRGIWSRRWSGSSSGTGASAGARTCGAVSLAQIEQFAAGSLSGSSRRSARREARGANFEQVAHSLSQFA